MKRTDSFTDFVREQLSTLGSVRAKAMFGGHGFYQGETLFGMEYRGKVFFRVDDKTRPRYMARGMKAFSPSAGMTMKNYFEVPLTLMDGALFRSLKLGPDEAAAATIAHLEAVERVRGLGGLLWHPNAAAEKLFPGWWRCFLAALDHLAARGAWVASVGEIADWWREREKLHGTMPDVD